MYNLAAIKAGLDYRRDYQQVKKSSGKTLNQVVPYFVSFTLIFLIHFYLITCTHFIATDFVLPLIVRRVFYSPLIEFKVTNLKERYVEYPFDRCEGELCENAKHIQRACIE